MKKNFICGGIVFDLLAIKLRKIDTGKILNLSRTIEITLNSIGFFNCIINHIKSISAVDQRVRPEFTNMSHIMWVIVNYIKWLLSSKGMDMCLFLKTVVKLSSKKSRKLLVAPWSSFMYLTKSSLASFGSYQW